MTHYTEVAADPGGLPLSGTRLGGRSRHDERLSGSLGVVAVTRLAGRGPRSKPVVQTSCAPEKA